MTKNFLKNNFTKALIFISIISIIIISVFIFRYEKSVREYKKPVLKKEKVDITRNFTNIIAQPNHIQLKILSPNGGEVKKTGEILPITFEIIWLESINPKPSITATIDLLRDGKEEQEIMQDWTGSIFTYDWTIPEFRDIKGIDSPVFLETDDKYKIRVRIYNRLGEEIASDVSDAPFTISANSLFNLLIAPQGGEIWEVGNSYEIKWDKSYFPHASVTIKIVPEKYHYQYRPEPGNDIPEFIFSSNDGSFLWQVDIKPGLYKIYVLGGGVTDAPPNNPFYRYRDKSTYKNYSDLIIIKFPSLLTRSRGDSNLDKQVGCDDLYHIFDVFYGAFNLSDLGNSDYNNDGEVALDDIDDLYNDLKRKEIICLSINTISPLRGPVGTEITLTGRGLNFPYPGEFSEPNLYFGNFGKGVLNDRNWEIINNETIKFVIPPETCTHESRNMGACMETMSITPGVYEVYISNTLGESNKVKFIVTD